MRDGPIRRAIKVAVRAIWWAELGWRRRARPPRFALMGTCEGCGACCERPTISVGRLLWYSRALRSLFVAWQRWVNGFVLLERVRRGRALVFRCTHYDPATRQCDSYASRPWMCRDYPRVVLDQAWPELFADCSHRLVDTEGLGLAAAIDALDLAPGQAVQLKARLRLPEEGGPTSR